MTDTPPSTAALVDACVRASIPLRLLPAHLLAPLIPGSHISGHARVVVHRGSVDVFLATLDESSAGEVLVIDNAAARDHACIGDLVVLEAARAGIVGIVLWGLHRDTAQLHDIGLPLWTLGAHPAGPAAADAPPERVDRVRLGDIDVFTGEVVVADADGVIVVSAEEWPRVSEIARGIVVSETKQADLMRAGTTLREQVDFDAYQKAVSSGDNITFRQHLRARQAEIEE